MAVSNGSVDFFSSPDYLHRGVTPSSPKCSPEFDFQTHEGMPDMTPNPWDETEWEDVAPVFNDLAHSSTMQALCCSPDRPEHPPAGVQSEEDPDQVWPPPSPKLGLKSACSFLRASDLRRKW